jgi:amidohydrolase
MCTFIVNIKGRGGHSSEPHKTIDPITIANQLCGALNMLIPREVNPESFATMTVGVINAGTASNIIPETAELQISIRTLSPEAYDHLMKRVPEVIEHYVKAWRGDFEVRIMTTPSTVCDGEFSDELFPFIAEIVGADNIMTVPPMKGAEDFGYVTKLAPSLYAMLGAGKPGSYPLHNPNTVIDEGALAIGTAILVNCVLGWLNEHKK